MNDLSRLDSTSEAILRALAEHAATPSNLAYTTSVDVLRFGRFLKNLIEHGYIRNSDITKEADKNIYMHDSYFVTLEGKAYLECIDRQSARDALRDKKDRRQTYINIINASISLIALIKSFLPEIISLLK